MGTKSFQIVLTGWAAYSENLSSFASNFNKPLGIPSGELLNLLGKEVKNLRIISSEMWNGEKEEVMVNGRWIGSRLESVILLNTDVKCVDGIDNLSSSYCIFIW